MCLLLEARPRAFELARDVEALCYALSTTAEEYVDRVLRAAFNLRENERVGLDVVRADDTKLVEGTLAGRIEGETKARQLKFEQMLQEKYDALNDGDFNAIVKCRRCGSTEVTWEEKQTRSADEGCTVFVACTTCQNRWVLK